MKYVSVLMSLMLICIVCFATGIGLVLSVDRTPKYLREVEVVEVNENSIGVKIDEKKKKPVIYETEKPFYIDYEVGDIVRVKYDKESDTYYNIDADKNIYVGMTLFILPPCVTLLGAVICAIFDAKGPILRTGIVFILLACIMLILLLIFSKVDIFKYLFLASAFIATVLTITGYSKE